MERNVSPSRTTYVSGDSGVGLLWGGAGFWISKGPGPSEGAWLHRTSPVRGDAVRGNETDVVVVTGGGQAAVAAVAGACRTGGECDGLPVNGLSEGRPATVRVEAGFGAVVVGDGEVGGFTTDRSRMGPFGRAFDGLTRAAFSTDGDRRWWQRSTAQSTRFAVSAILNVRFMRPF